MVLIPLCVVFREHDNEHDQQPAALLVESALAVWTPLRLASADVNSFRNVKPTGTPQPGQMSLFVSNTYLMESNRFLTLTTVRRPL